MVKDHRTVLARPTQDRLCLHYGSCRLCDRLSSGTKSRPQGRRTSQEANGKESKLIAIEKRRAVLMMKLFDSRIYDYKKDRSLDALN